jgi:hypothetical protein
MFCCLLLSVTQIIVVNLSRSDQFWIPSSPSESASSSTASAPTAARPITVFYNVYADPDRIDNARDIVSEQMQHIMPEHRVFVRSIGAQFPIENATRIQHAKRVLNSKRWASFEIIAVILLTQRMTQWSTFITRGHSILPKKTPCFDDSLHQELSRENVLKCLQSATFAAFVSHRYRILILLGTCGLRGVTI